MLQLLSAGPRRFILASRAVCYTLTVKRGNFPCTEAALSSVRNLDGDRAAHMRYKTVIQHSCDLSPLRFRFCTAATTAASSDDGLQAHIPLEAGLYLVGTPIGNLEDISLRALRILRTATIVLAEDTRHSKKLLNHFSIKAQLYSFHQHNEHSREQVVLEQLARGASVAVISDAGMPLISDPGSGLVQAAVAAGFQVIPVPGPSAFLLALVASGLPSTQFTFAGFLADKAKARQRQLQNLADVAHTLVFYVPPHDLLGVLTTAATILGPQRQCVVARELTKVHEEFFRSSLAGAVEHYGLHAAKGEITLLVQGADIQEPALTEEDLGTAVTAAMASGQSLSSAAKSVSKQLGVSRSKAYAAALSAATGKSDAREGMDPSTS